MRISIQSAASRLPMPWYGFAALAAYAGIAAGVYAIGRLSGSDWTLCLFKRLTGGIPCMGCRGTRAGLRLLHGDIAGALWFNPLLTAVFVAVPAALALRIATRKTLRIHLSRGECSLAVALGLLAFVANWAYVIHMEGLP